MSNTLVPLPPTRWRYACDARSFVDWHFGQANYFILVYFNFGNLSKDFKMLIRACKQRQHLETKLTEIYYLGLIQKFKQLLIFNKFINIGRVILS